MLLEQGVGDAYCIAWEFCHGQKGANDLASYHQNPNYPEFPAGMYSDDTMRALANAGVVLGDPRRWFDPLAYVEAYQTAYRADPRKGWSRGFQAYLEANRDATPTRFMSGLRRRATNGAVMGVAPLGFLPDEETVRMACVAQCVSTHHGSTASSAQAVALAAHYLLFDKGPRHAILDYLDDQVDWSSKDEAARILCRGNSIVPRAAMPAWTIAAGALFLLIGGGFTGLADRLAWVADQGRVGHIDADSLAAVAMAICSCDQSIPQDLPIRLVDGLEDEDGRRRLRAVDHDLKRFAGLLPAED